MALKRLLDPLGILNELSPSQSKPSATASPSPSRSPQLELPRAEELERIAFTIDHRTLTEALMADLIDLVPVIGDLTNLMRIIDAVDRKDYLAASIQAGDLPGITNLLPANLAVYLLRRRR